MLSNNNNKKMKLFAVTGTSHGSLIYAFSEGEARRLFHKHYNGESILCVKVKADNWFPI